MSWAKLSDDFGDDCWTLSDRAFRLHVEGLCFNGRKLLDCRIPVDDVRRFAKDPEAVDELLAGGWWERAGAVYVIRHHAGYQRLREAVLAQQAANTENGKKGGRPKGAKTKPRSAETQSASESLTETETETETERDRTGQAGLDRETDCKQQIDYATGEITDPIPQQAPPSPAHPTPTHDPHPQQQTPTRHGDHTPRQKATAQTERYPRAANDTVKNRCPQCDGPKPFEGDVCRTCTRESSAAGQGGRQADARRAAAASWGLDREAS